MQKITAEFIHVPDVPAPGEIGVDVDIHYRAALGFAAGARMVSATLLERTLPTTPDAAGQIMSRLQEAGIVGPPDHIVHHGLPDWRAVNHAALLALGPAPEVVQ